MHPRAQECALAASSCTSDAMAWARGKNASVELLARLNARRKSCWMAELDRYPSDSELREYFNERMKK